MNQTGYLFLGLIVIVSVLAAVLAYAVLRIFAAARAVTRAAAPKAPRRRSWPRPWKTRCRRFGHRSVR